MPDTHPCDRCGAVIFEPPCESPGALRFTLTVSGAAAADPKYERARYEMVERTLCAGCERELLHWIDEGAVDRRDRVDLPDRLVAASALHQTADDLAALADDLTSALDTAGETDG